MFSKGGGDDQILAQNTKNRFPILFVPIVLAEKNRSEKANAAHRLCLNSQMSRIFSRCIYQKYMINSQINNGYQCNDF
jgi:hypothetical protein